MSNQFEDHWLVRLIFGTAVAFWFFSVALLTVMALTAALKAAGSCS